MRLVVALLLLFPFSVLAQLTKNQTCEAYAVFRESMSESVEGSLAVLTVLRNRARIDKKTTCQVVAAKGQWSWYASNRNIHKWKLSKEALTRYHKVDSMEPNLSSDVYFFHSGKGRKKWGRWCCKIGNHKFYFK